MHTMKAERDLLESGEKRARSLYEELLREQRGHQVGSYYTGGVLLQLGYILHCGVLLHWGEGLNAVRVCTGTLWGSYYTGGGEGLTAVRVWYRYTVGSYYTGGEGLTAVRYVQVHCGGLTTLGGEGLTAVRVSYRYTVGSYYTGGEGLTAVRESHV